MNSRFIIPVLGFAFPFLEAIGGELMPSRKFRGLAVEMKSGRSLYEELHGEGGEGGKVRLLETAFVNPKGDTIATRTLDFSRSTTQPIYLFSDRRSGWEEGASLEADGFRVHCRKGRDKARKEKLLQVPEPAVIDGGFNNFLRECMADLQAGKRIRFNFVVPSRLDWFRFGARMDKEKSKSGLVVLTAEPENAMLRLVAPKIQVTYDPVTGLMAGYQGISNVAAQGGGNQYIRLTYPDGGP